MVKASNRPRIGLFIDAPFDAREVAGQRQIFSGSELFGFMGFAAAVADHLDGLVLIGRGVDNPELATYPVGGRFELIALPHYPSLRDLGALVRRMPKLLQGLWRSLDGLDLVWISAANPIGLILLGLARLRRVKTALLVRQNSMEYFRRRLPSRAWTPVLAPLWLVDRAFRISGRFMPVTAVGSEVARQYGAPLPNVLNFMVNRVSDDEILELDEDRGERPEFRLLTVGRIEQEKNPLLWIELVKRLEEQMPGRFRATWIGDGRMRQILQEVAEAGGVADRVSLPGFIPFGEELARQYRDADLFVHVSLTEGVPGVLVEAMAAGLPVLATDVGGVRDACDDGRAAALVPPEDLEALVEGVIRLQGDAAGRRELVERGLALARRHSLEAESRRVADVLAGELA